MEKAISVNKVAKTISLLSNLEANEMRQKTTHTRARNADPNFNGMKLSSEMTKRIDAKLIHPRQGSCWSTRKEPSFINAPRVFSWGRGMISVKAADASSPPQ